jgi:hypothetical protein
MPLMDGSDYPPASGRQRPVKPYTTEELFLKEVERRAGATREQMFGALDRWKLVGHPRDADYIADYLRRILEPPPDEIRAYPPDSETAKGG